MAAVATIPHKVATPDGQSGFKVRVQYMYEVEVLTLCWRMRIWKQKVMTWRWWCGRPAAVATGSAQRSIGHQEEGESQEERGPTHHQNPAVKQQIIRHPCLTTNSMIITFSQMEAEVT